MDGSGIPDLLDWLRRLAEGGLAGLVIAFLFERVSWFQGLGPRAKWWAILGGSVGLPLVASLLVEYVPSHVWAILNPHWRALAGGFAVWAASQLSHRWLNGGARPGPEAMHKPRSGR